VLNTPWIDPRTIDWTDAMNPLAKPGLKRNNNPFGYSAMQDVFLQALRQGKGIEPRIYVCPDPSNQLVAGGGNTLDYEVPSEPNCWLWALNASGEHGSSFLVNVTDSVTGAALFSQPVPFTQILSGDGTGTANRGPLFLLSTPHLFQPPSYPVVRIINIGDTHVCRVTLFTCVEYNL
jgi:hypothetical protein